MIDRKSFETAIARSATFNRVLVVDTQGIMGASLEKFLTEEPLVEVYGLVWEEKTDLVQEILRLLPDTIIMVFESGLMTPNQLLDALPDYGRIRIILVSVISNVIDVYDRQHIQVDNYFDLINQLNVS